MIAHGNASPTPPTRVVLVGARFVGGAIERRLAHIGVQALPLKRKDVDLAQAGAAQQLASKLREGDAVVMLAVDTPGRLHDAAALERSVAMMRSVCDAVGAAGSAHFVYFSSDAVYPGAVSRVTEETPPSPGGLYGVTHLAREAMTRAVEAPWLVLRPTQIYGAADPHNSYGPNRFCRAAMDERRIALSDSGTSTRDHVHVDDVADLAVRCLLRRSTGTLNVATGVSHSFLDVANVVAKRFAVPVSVGPAGAVSHRHYDITNTIKAFPDIRFTALEDGIARVHREMKERA